MSMTLNTSALEASSHDSATLNFQEQLLERARLLDHCGFLRESTSLYSQLMQLDPETSSEKIADLLLRRGKYTRARRHLTAAISRLPNQASLFFLMAQAILNDEKCQQDRAERFLRRAVELAPKNAEYRAELGQYLLDMNQVETGLEELRHAVELAPDQFEVVEKAVSGFWEEGETDEARSLLQRSLFRNREDRRFTMFWERFEFEAAREEREVNPGLHVIRETGPRILKFEEKTIRIDTASKLRGPRRRS